MEDPIEVNDLEFEGWHFDVFITKAGALGITVYEKGKSRKDDDIKFRDVIIPENMDVVVA